MEKLHSRELVSTELGEIHIVSMKGVNFLPSWLVHTQIELDGNRVFVRWIDTKIGSDSDSPGEVIGIVVSPVY
ncbi:MAG: hypothetical protein KTR18_09285 [Acidiferrobacterales bacterium]|nr:hypothetical protein [Acidiferrobacterales bacterium]